MPLPDPVPEIVTVTSLWAAMKASATCCIAGSTVVEPFTVTVPAQLEPIIARPATAPIVINFAFISFRIPFISTTAAGSAPRLEAKYGEAV